MFLSLFVEIDLVLCFIEKVNKYYKAFDILAVRRLPREYNIRHIFTHIHTDSTVRLQEMFKLNDNED